MTKKKSPPSSKEKDTVQKPPKILKKTKKIIFSLEKKKTFRILINIFSKCVIKTLMFFAFLNTWVSGIAQKLKGFYEKTQRFENQKAWMDPLALAKHEEPKLTVRLLFWTLAFMCISLFIWSTCFKIDEYVHAQSKVEPESELNVITHLEGGVIESIHVKEGQFIKKGDVLVKLKDDPLRASHKEKQEGYHLTLGHIERLKAQIHEKPFVMPREVNDFSKSIARDIQAAYEDRMTSYQNDKKIAMEQIEQKENELNELEIREKNLKKAYKLAIEEVELLEPLVKKQLVGKTQLIRSEKDKADKFTQLESAKASIPKVKSSLQEARNKLDQVKSNYIQKDQQDLTTRQEQFSSFEAQMSQSSDRLERSVIVSPIDGIVQDVMNITLGSAISPGKEFMTVVPVKDKLLVIAEVQPQDIGFIHEGNEATIKISAYDYSIYGSMKGVVEHISPDTYFDPQHRPYFKVKILSNSNAITHNGRDYLISPGMTAQVDILTGRRTVMHYLLKPIIKTLDSSMHER